MAEPGSKYSVNPAPPVAKTVELPVWTWSVAEEHLEIDERHGLLRAKKKLEPYEDLELGKLEVKRRAAIDLAFKELSKERKEAEKLMRRFKHNISAHCTPSEKKVRKRWLVETEIAPADPGIVGSTPTFEISLRSWPLAIGSHPSQRGVMTLPAGAGVQSLRNMFDGKLSQSMRGMSSRAFSSRSTSGGTSPGGGGGGGGHRGAAKASRSAACAVS